MTNPTGTRRVHGFCGLAQVSSWPQPLDLERAWLRFHAVSRLVSFLASAGTSRCGSHVRAWRARALLASSLLTGLAACVAPPPWDPTEKKL